jgi:hypothetical protein
MCQDLTLLPALPPPPPLFWYEFREPLMEGVVQQRKGRFTLEVLVDGEMLLCHCPSTALHPNTDLLNSGKARPLHGLMTSLS